MVKEGRLPISTRNIETVPLVKDKDKRTQINEHSRDADLVIMGFRGELLRHEKAALFDGYDEVGSILFVNTLREIDIDRVVEEVPGTLEEEEEEEKEGGAQEKEATEKEQGKKEKSAGKQKGDKKEDKSWNKLEKNGEEEEEKGEE